MATNKFTMQIQFTRDVSVTDHNGKVVFSAAAGEVRELEQASARRWLRRNAAMRYIQAEKPARARKPGRPKKATPEAKPEPVETKLEDDNDGADSEGAETVATPAATFRRAPPIT